MILHFLPRLTSIGNLYDTDKTRYLQKNDNRSKKQKILTHPIALYCVILFISICDPRHLQSSKFFLKSVPLPANKSAAEVEKAYLEEIVDKTYTTQCGGSKCLSAGLNRLSFDKWKELNGFNTNAITTVRYYNSADLGLGRDMNCVSLANDTSRGKDAMSCYVSNHGTLGGGAEVAFDALGKIDLEKIKASRLQRLQCKLDLHQPQIESVFVFGDDNLLVNLGGAEKIILDSGTGHSQPAVCMNCHGGNFSSDGSSVNNAHFCRLTLRH